MTNTTETIQKLTVHSKSLLTIVQKITPLHFPKVMQQQFVGEVVHLYYSGVKFLQDVIYQKLLVASSWNYSKG